MEKRRGFTLIEIMVTVIVMGILVTIALPRAIKIIEKSRGSEAREVLLKAYAGYQRRVVDGETVGWGQIQNNWAGLGMSDPSADSRHSFNYTWDNTGGVPRLRALRKGNTSKNLTVFLNNGTIIATQDY